MANMVFSKFPTSETLLNKTTLTTLEEFYKIYCIVCSVIESNHLIYDFMLSSFI